MLKMIQKRMIKKQVNHLEKAMDGKGKFIESSQEGQLLLQTLVGLATLVGVSPKDLANQSMKLDRFRWYMDEMTKEQLKNSLQDLEKVGDMGFEAEVSDLKNKIKERLEADSEDKSDTTSK